MTKCSHIKQKVHNPKRTAHFTCRYGERITLGASSGEGTVSNISSSLLDLSAFHSPVEILDELTAADEAKFMNTMAAQIVRQLFPTKDFPSNNEYYRYEKPIKRRKFGK
ncbi:hypothetical protein ACQKP0_23450 [Heyndrickxia sp. NPDC080065]|uniref:hypothetical protein n=1 Tax=Heyndrickxia sp. NPDC080065 TaxID=3390568 RepID=UPI003CFF5688